MIDEGSCVTIKTGVEMMKMQFCIKIINYLLKYTILEKVLGHPLLMKGLLLW